MITIKSKGDLLKEKVDVLVNTVNCVGIMGKGIALQFKMAFPENYKAYKKACDHGEVLIGKMFVTETHNMFAPKYIINFPTKKHWKEKSKIEYIEKGLDNLIEHIKRLNIQSIAIPPLGCGYGGLEWESVKKLIISKLKNINSLEIRLFAPSASPPPAELMKIRTLKPNMTAGRAALIGLLKNYKQIGYQVTMLEIQKLMYFLQVAGEPLRLNFKKYKYGPYSNQIHHVLQYMEGHFIQGYGDRSRQIQISLLPEGGKEAEKFLAKNQETQQRSHKVLELIEGFETPYGLELLSTVHWTIDREQITEIEEIVKSIQNWNPRKKGLFGAKHIKIAKDRLEKAQFL
jgi:O-acetyl-ADP-ribose deacetylase (regulator of RNase III)